MYNLSDFKGVNDNMYHKLWLKHQHECSRNSVYSLGYDLKFKWEKFSLIK